MKFGSGVLGVEPPVDGGLGGVALLLQSLDFLPEGLLVGKPLFEARAGQNAELYLRHVQPTAVLGGVVELQPFGDPPGLGSREGLVQRRRAMGVQIVQNHPHYLGLRVGLIRQPTHLLGEVLGGAPLGQRHVTPAGQRLTGQEQVAGSLPPVLVVLAQRPSRLGWKSGPRLRQQLGGGLVPPTTSVRLALFPQPASRRPRSAPTPDAETRAGRPRPSPPPAGDWLARRRISRCCPRLPGW